MMEGVNLRYIVSTFINVTMYSQYNNNLIIKMLAAKRKKNKILISLTNGIKQLLMYCHGQ
jgi:hypothetical protein